MHSNSLSHGRAKALEKPGSAIVGAGGAPMELAVEVEIFPIHGGMQDNKCLV